MVYLDVYGSTVYMWYLFPLFPLDFSQSPSPTEHSIGFCGRTSGLNLQCLVKSSQTFFFFAMGDETINDEEAGTATARDGVRARKLWSGMDGF